ncbi:PREDICTED: F-box protein At3g26010-like [Camelina sativa]|uniref:F-box protein At3g26010-like n=1 Tax=Camelina sativa TaxID=90675 RepID=A0ABM1QKS5_CAMSA|nr:PREDICTED: F-box protein At3g26010-like [Camelina sativa]
MDGYNGVSYVGNPVLQQWVEVPYPPYPRSLPVGLVTRVDEDGVVLSFKVLTVAALEPSPDKSSTFDYDADLTLPGALIAYDVYGESNLCQVIPLPDHNVNHNSDFKRAYTTSTGFVIDDDDSGWQLEWKLPLPFIRPDDDISYYAPLAMHPFDRNIIYIWSQQNRYLVSCNLQKLNYKILRDDDQSIDDLQNCFVNQSVCEEEMDDIFGPYSHQEYVVPIISFHSLLPRWIESMPCPPQVEIIDTTSLLSNIYLKTKKNIGK